MSLKTDYQNFVPAESMGGLRRYTLIDNPDGTVSLQDATEYQIEGDRFGADDINAITKAVNYTVVDATLSVSNWNGSPPTYDLEVAGATETNINEILPAVDIMSSQLEALQAANIVDGGQTEGHITIKAMGEQPNVDIPIRVIVRGDI